MSNVLFLSQPVLNLTTSTLLAQAICTAATNIGRATVEDPPKSLSDRSPYDIWALAEAEIAPVHWIDYVNTAFVQNALVVNLTFTSDCNEMDMTC